MSLKLPQDLQNPFPHSPWSTAQLWMDLQDGGAWLCPVNPEVASASHFLWLSLKCRVLSLVSQLSILGTSCYVPTDCVSIFKLEKQRHIPVNFSDGDDCQDPQHMSALLGREFSSVLPSLCLAWSGCLWHRCQDCDRALIPPNPAGAAGPRGGRTASTSCHPTTLHFCSGCGALAFQRPHSHSSLALAL